MPAMNDAYMLEIKDAKFYIIQMTKSIPNIYGCLLTGMMCFIRQTLQSPWKREAAKTEINGYSIVISVWQLNRIT